MKLKKILFFWFMIVFFSVLSFCCDVQKQVFEPCGEKPGHPAYEACKMERLHSAVGEHMKEIKDFIWGDASRQRLEGIMRALREHDKFSLGVRDGVLKTGVDACLDLLEKQMTDNPKEFKFRVKKINIENYEIEPDASLETDESKATVFFEIHVIESSHNSTLDGFYSLFHIKRCRWN